MKEEGARDDFGRYSGPTLVQSHLCSHALAFYSNCNRNHLRFLSKGVIRSNPNCEM